MGQSYNEKEAKERIERHHWDITRFAPLENKEVTNLIHGCCAVDLEKRPTVTAILAEIERLLPLAPETGNNAELEKIYCMHVRVDRSVCFPFPNPMRE